MPTSLWHPIEASQPPERPIASLAAEVQAGTLTSAFDVRLAELYLASTLPAEQFGWFAGDSAVIGNYAHTPRADLLTLLRSYQC